MNTKAPASGSRRMHAARASDACLACRQTPAMRQRAVLGYCGKHRSTDVAAEGPSCIGTYGRWYTQAPGRRCKNVHTVAPCDSCRFVSFSAQTVDCSLYATCDVTHLKKGHGYMTLDVRQSSEPGSYSRRIASDRLPAAKVAQGAMPRCCTQT